jgi:hypothetical protein
MGGYFHVYAISISGQTIALTADDDALSPGYRKKADTLARHLVAARNDGSPPSGQVEVKLATEDEHGKFDRAIMDDSIDEKWAALRDQAAQIAPNDWNRLDGIDWVMLE